MISQNNQSTNGSNITEFIIGNYLHLLKPSNPKDKSKFFCPICSNPNFSIAQSGKAAGKAYKCHVNQCEGKKIAYELRRLNEEFDGKQASTWSTAINELTQLQIAVNVANSYNLDEDGQPKTQTSQTYNNQTKINPNYLYRRDKQNNLIQVFSLSLNHEILAFLKEKYETSEIKFNLRTKLIEIYGEPIFMDTITALIGEKHQVTIPQEKLERNLLLLARRNQYDPIKEYLQRCSLKHPNITSKKLLEGTLAKKLFGCDGEIYQTYLNIFLVSAVKRVYEPGCKIDLTLILQGKQGLGKTSFFDILSNGWFTSSMSHKLDKDDITLAARNLFVEWGELESFTAKEYKSKIKNFLTIREDSLRLPYGRTTEIFPRNFLIVGTTNEPQFLTDPEGNRRFMIMPVSKKLDRIWLEENASLIWTAAIALYETKYQTFLTEEQEKSQAKENRNFDKQDPWTDCISTYLRNHALTALENPNHWITAKELWSELERYYEPNFNYSGDRADNNRLGDLMKRLGWKSKQKWLERKNIMIYEFIGTIDLYE